MSIFLAEKVLSAMPLEAHVKDALKEVVIYNIYAERVSQLVQEDVVEERAHEIVLNRFANEYIEYFERGELTREAC